jgi:hypothetical protein
MVKVYNQLIIIKKMSTAISLCIPRVFDNITETNVYNVFNKLNIGKIHSINMIKRTNKKNKIVKCVFINLDNRYFNESSQYMWNELMSGKEIKIVYDDPWFWNVSIKRNRNKPLAPTKNIAPGVQIKYKKQEDNPDIYADDEKMIKRMKPINYSLIRIPVPKKKNLKIRK